MHGGSVVRECDGRVAAGIAEMATIVPVHRPGWMTTGFRSAPVRFAADPAFECQAFHTPAVNRLRRRTPSVPRQPDGAVLG